MVERHTWPWKLAHQINQFLLAVSFLTRLPVPSDLYYRADVMHSALRYFPLVGWILAGFVIAFWLFCSPWLGQFTTLCLMLAVSLLLTGALHEDGLADCFDGFYGGFDVERKLTIMKDSRLGTYGTAALVMALVTKLSLWWSLVQHDLLVEAVLLAYPLSRALAISHAQDLVYVSAPGNSKSDPLAKPLSVSMLIQVFVFGSLALLFLPWTALLTVVPLAIVLRWVLKHWMYKHIHGFTGDSLGAAQQVQELGVYLALVVLANGGWFENTGAWL